MVVVCLFFNKWCWNNWISTSKNEFRCRRTPATENSKWIIFSNVKCQTIKLLDYNMGEYLDNLVYGNDFLSTTPKT